MAHTSIPYFRYIVAEIAEGSVVTMRCEDPQSARPITAVAGFTITNEEGSKTGRVNSSAMGAWVDTNIDGISVRVGSANSGGLYGLPRQRSDWHLETTGIAAVRSTLRAAWASWGADRACVTSVDGVTLEPTFIEDADVRAVSPAEFRGGASLQGANLGVAVASTYPLRADGYLFSLFAPGGGSSRMLGPEGQNYVSQQVPPPYIPIVVMTPTSGSWSYEMDTSVLSAAPVLWTMVIPN
ncbi:MAG TPA: hypothetical protein VM600_00240 [Actinomycetota bacterium]|nr:hypothetical protein [Actinomycetota bacterium]